MRNLRVKKTLIKIHRQFNIYEVTGSRVYPDGEIWIETDEDLEYYVERISGYCKTISDAEKFIETFWKGLI